MRRFDYPDRAGGRRPDPRARWPKASCGGRSRSASAIRWCCCRARSPQPCSPSRSSPCAAVRAEGPGAVQGGRGLSSKRERLRDSPVAFCEVTPVGRITAAGGRACPSRRGPGSSRIRRRSRPGGELVDDVVEKSGLDLNDISRPTGRLEERGMSLSSGSLKAVANSAPRCRASLLLLLDLRAQHLRGPVEVLLDLRAGDVHLLQLVEERLEWRRRAGHAGAWRPPGRARDALALGRSGGCGEARAWRARTGRAEVAARREAIRIMRWLQSAWLMVRPDRVRQAHLPWRGSRRWQGRGKDRARRRRECRQRRASASGSWMRPRCASRMTWPPSVTKGAPSAARRRRRSPAGQGIQQPAMAPPVALRPKGTTSIGSGKRPSRSTRFEPSAMTIMRRLAAATIFSRRSAPPPPLMRRRSSSISSAPSIVRSSSGVSSRVVSGMPSRWACVAGRLRGRHADDLQAAAHALAQGGDEMRRRGAGAEAEPHAVGDERGRPFGRRAFEVSLTEIL